MKNMLAAAATAAVAAFATVVAQWTCCMRGWSKRFSKGQEKQSTLATTAKRDAVCLAISMHIHIHIYMHIKLQSVCVCKYLCVHKQLQDTDRRTTT